MPKFVMRFTPKKSHWQVETWATAIDWKHAKEKFNARKIPMARNTLLEIWGGEKGFRTKYYTKKVG